MTLIALLGCTIPDFGGGYGADPGGVQDFDYVRQTVADGGVPREEDVVVEGLLSEHVIPTDDTPCDALLCARPSATIAPSLADGEDRMWVHLGLASGLPADAERPPMDLVLVIDHSSSMIGDMGQVEDAVVALLGALRDDDRVAVIAYNGDVDVLQDLGPVEPGIEGKVRALDPEGGWDADAAMERALAIHQDAGDTTTRTRRIALLTCGYPTVEGAFGDAVNQAANERIGTSVYGVMLGWDPELGDLLGQTRGGAYSYTSSLEETEAMFTDDFDQMLTPLAYDLAFSLNLSSGWDVDGVFGVPGDDAVETPSFEVATAFLSDHAGSVVVRLDAAEGPASIGTVDLSYDPEPAYGWTEANATSDELAGSQDAAGPRTAAALVNEAERMATACGRYWDGDAGEAISILEELATYLEGERDALDDASLDDEIALVQQLAANMQ